MQLPAQDDEWAKAYANYAEELNRFVADRVPVTETEDLLQEVWSSLAVSLKNTTISHLLRLAPFSVDNVKIGGNRHIVNAASKGHGPSWRMVVELGDGEVNAWGVYPGSQSGNPGNPNYAHMVQDWATGEYNKLLFSEDINADSEQINYSLTIQPK